MTQSHLIIKNLGLREVLILFNDPVVKLWVIGVKLQYYRAVSYHNSIF